MQAPEVERRDAHSAPAQSRPDDPFSEGAGGRAVSRIAEQLAVAQESARGMLEAEDALRLARQRFERAEDPQIRAELAVEALDHVERELRLTRERRQQLDGIEGGLWARRNRLERFLIRARGRAWWHARRKSGAAASQSQAV
jgi:hypothetical protein